MKKSTMAENFEEIFNLPPAEIEDSKNISVYNSADKEQDIETDYQYARENLYKVIESGSGALDELVELAKQSQSPRAFEIVGQLVKTLTDANKDLLEVQKKVKDLKREEKSKGPNNVTNALFVGNTTDLQKMLKDNGNV